MKHVVPLTLSLVLCCTGCGGKHVPVRGEVTLDGEPVADARVSLEPVREQEEVAAENMGAYGVTDKNGCFRLEMVDSGSRKIPAGTYHARVLTFGDGPALPDSSFEPRRVAIPRGGTYQLDFHFEAPDLPPPRSEHMTTGKEPIITDIEIKPRKTDKRHLPDTKKPGDD